ncbi:MAG: 50S ribosomal protein L10 [Acidobacteriota bacterium]|nr:50S ribosomal protein L10 [Acidobacteriota bacterium]
MDRDTKKQIVEQLKTDLDGVSSIFLCDFKGLTVEKDTQLRRSMREQGSSYSVVKNTLLKLAIVDSDFDKVDDHLAGNTALAYNRESAVELAKLIRDFSKDNQAFKFKAGVIEGKVIDVNGLEALASLPPKEVLVSKLMFMMNYPVQGLVTSLSGVIRNLAVVLDQVKEKKSEDN